jgi:hypothetical protein
MYGGGALGALPVELLVRDGQGGTAREMRNRRETRMAGSLVAFCGESGAAASGVLRLVDKGRVEDVR